jgi:speckle-type POZ protein
MKKDLHKIEHIQTLDVGKPPSSREDSWKSFNVLFHAFRDLSTEKEHAIDSPTFLCNGHEWFLRMYPGSCTDAENGQITIFLHHIGSESTELIFKVSILDRFGREYCRRACETSFNKDGMKSGVGWDDFIHLDTILDESRQILDSNGTLAVVVSIKAEPAAPFVPKNPFPKMMQGLFLDEETADVCFELSVAEKKDEDVTGESTLTFNAHSLVLETCAPMLSALCESSDGDKMKIARITDLKPEIFRIMLWYVYGGSVKKEDLTAHAKDIIDAADKYSIVNLKLEAEAVYVKSTYVTMKNAVEILLYADAKNCALLKETAVDFLAANCDDVIDEISFDDVPGHLMKDLLVATARRKKKSCAGVAYDYMKDGYCADDLKVLNVTELRIKLNDLGLDVDGSREAMIEALKFDEDSEEGSYVKVDEGSGVSREEGENDEE